MEEFVYGDIVTYDGLSDRDGNTIFSSTLAYNIAVLDIVEQNADMYYCIPRSIEEDIVEAGEKIVKAFGLKERFFHIELFREFETGRLIALEINCRVPGGKTTDMFNYANDFDVYALYADLVAGRDIDIVQDRPYFCCYASRKAFRDYVYTNEQLWEMYPQELISIESIPGVFAAVMGDYGFLLRTPHEETMNQIISDISQTRS